MKTLQEKLQMLTPALRAKIVTGERKYSPAPGSPISNWLVRTKRHCNGGRTVDAGLWLKAHCDRGGRIFLTMAGAGSSFQLGVSIGDLIRADKVAAISVTAANMEESFYRLVGNSYYAYIPDYQELTRAEEKELDHAGLRRITDTFLPEEESVRVILSKLQTLWAEAAESGEYLLWHEYFFRLFEREMVEFDPTANPDDCWLYQAWLHQVPVFVPGAEDSTMGNIFAWASYDGNHPFLRKYKADFPISPEVVHHSFRYMHRLAEWYMDSTRIRQHAFLQLGGGIAADFPICVVPHLKKDYLAEELIAEQEKLIPAWAGFVEIFSSPMSYGSYSGAGGKEKITWSKLEPDAFVVQICGDYTEHFPDIAALVLGW